MVQPFSALFKDSWAFSQRHMMQVIVTAIALGLIIFLLQLSTGVSFLTHMTGPGRLTPDQMQQMMQRAASGNEEDVTAILETLDSSGTATAFLQFTPLLFLSFVVMFILYTLAMTAYLVLAVKAPGDVNQLFSMTFSKFWNVLVLSVWMFLRAFAWVPFIGPILGIIFYPRMIAAPVIMLETNKGVMDCVSESIKKTKGYWGKIVGNGILVGVVLWVIAVVVSAVIPVLAPVVMMVSMGFMIIFSVHLARTVMANPRVA